ncbi:MAG: hypothetical protein QXZ22_08180 [Sulfolobales archaeon]
MSVQVRVDLKEIYKMLCDECKKKLVKYVKEKMDEEFIRKQLEGD